jgi:hypothetical protein
MTASQGEDSDMSQAEYALIMPQELIDLHARLTSSDASPLMILTDERLPPEYQDCKGDARLLVSTRSGAEWAADYARYEAMVRSLCSLHHLTSLEIEKAVARAVLQT